MQLVLDAYWKQIGGNTMLPGTNRAADRDGQPDVIGNQTANFKPAVPFPFLALH